MLGYLLVLLIAGAVGWGVYWLTLRWGVRNQPTVPADVGEWKSADPGPEPFMTAAPPGGAYLPVATGQPSWQTRLSGVLGLAIAVAVAAIGSAFALYTVGRLIAQMLKSSAAG